MNRDPMAPSAEPAVVDKMPSKLDIDTLLTLSRERLERELRDFRPAIDGAFLSQIDRFLADDTISKLEKAFYLLIHQYGAEDYGYAVVPGERVRVEDVYERDPDRRYYDYELDFAVYSGSRTNSVKIAIECDGIRSHRKRHANRDRRKDVNLQAAGWIVLRFGADEIKTQIALHVSGEPFTTVRHLIDNIVAAKSDQLNSQTCFWPDVRSRLTGYTWSNKECSQCDHSQVDYLELTTECRHCGARLPAVDTGGAA